MRAVWEAFGSNVEVMTPAHHDLVLAITSHLPHLIAYNIVATAADIEEVTNSEVIKFSAGGFRDFTRIAAGDPQVWRDILLANRAQVLAQARHFEQGLAALEKSIEAGDAAGLEALIRQASDTRSRWRMGQD